MYPKQIELSRTVIDTGNAHNSKRIAGNPSSGMAIEAESLRVLMAHNYYQIRGGEDVSAEAEERLLRLMGHPVHFLTKNNGDLSQPGTARDAINCTWSSGSKREVKSVLQRKDIDVLHVQNFFPQFSPSIYYAASEEGIPVVQTLRNFRLLCPAGTLFRDGGICEKCVGQSIAIPGIARACYRNSRAATASVALMASAHRVLATWEKSVTLYIALSDFARQKMIEGGFSEEKIVVKPNFVHPDPGVANEEKDNFALFVGRLSPEKGISTLLRAWEQLDCPLKIVGTGELLPDVLAAVERNSRIEYLGTRSIGDTYELMGRALVLVAPSEGFETFGRVIIEAFARGTPVIASRQGALEELVDDGITGRLFSPGADDELGTHIEQMINNRSFTLSMGLEARNVFLRRFTAHQNYRALLDIYQRALQIVSN